MTFLIKKPYAAPELTVYGDVEKLTEQNGRQFNDTPFGSTTTNNDNGNYSRYPGVARP